MYIYAKSLVTILAKKLLKTYFKKESFNRLVAKLSEDNGNRRLGNGNSATLVLS